MVFGAVPETGLRQRVSGILTLRWENGAKQQGVTGADPWLAGRGGFRRFSGAAMWLVYSQPGAGLQLRTDRPSPDVSNGGRTQGPWQCILGCCENAPRLNTPPKARAREQ